MSVLTSYFDKSVNQASPVQKDVVRTVKRDADGSEIILYPEVDYPKLQESNGCVGDWALTNLLKAGINPVFGIHTSVVDRLGLEDVASGILADVESNLKTE